MRIQHNVMAMNAYRNYSNNTSALSKNLERLSSGYKINRAGDDAAGLAISEKMRAQITGLEAAQKNVKDGISLVNTAEGAMQEVQDMLNRMVYLAQESANGTYDNEVDRANLQKELDQLNSEIDRIADSANFNGIKLLNGTLGLNTDAFTDIKALAGADATDGALNVTDYVAAKTASYSNLHLETSSTAAAAPAATIDLGSLALTGEAAGDTLKVSVAGTEYTLTATAVGDLDSSTKIATALKAAMQAHATVGVDPATGAHDGADATKNTAVRIGDGVYTLGGSGSAIELTYAGRFNGATYIQETTFTGDAAAATNLNSSLGFAVEKGVTSGAGTVTGDVIHDTTQVSQAVAKVDAGLAGIDMTLSSDFVTQGGKLTIDGQTFIFQTEAGNTPTGTGTVIDVSKGTTDAERLHLAADALSKQTVTGTDGRTWKIGVENGNTIHIEQTGASNSGKELKTYEDLTSKITVNGQASAQKFAGAQVTIDDSKVQEGNTLTIGGKQYVFSDKKTGTDGNTVYVAMKGGAGANLQAAVAKDTNLTAEYDAGTKVFTVRGANANVETPSILGKGLTLQIGDTSDSYNQLSVLINDIHASTLGTRSISIADQDSAAAAVDVIKDAINTISSIRGTLGATSNRLDHTANNLSVMRENITDAESSIRDTDIAEEMMSYTKNNILVQSAQAMLAQANQVPQGVLQLLQ